MNNKKKGFTLVELIVVLAILAILAAMLVPALTGYIDKANEKKIVSTTRQVVVAAQTVVSEKYAQTAGSFKNSQVLINKSNFGNIVDNDADNKIDIVEICELAEILADDFSYNEVGNTFTGSLKNDIVSIIINYSKEGVIENVSVSFGKLYCTYNGLTGEYDIQEFTS